MDQKERIMFLASVIHQACKPATRLAYQALNSSAIDFVIGPKVDDDERTKDIVSAFISYHVTEVTSLLMVATGHTEANSTTDLGSISPALLSVVEEYEQENQALISKLSQRLLALSLERN